MYFNDKKLNATTVRIQNTKKQLRVFAEVAVFQEFATCIAVQCHMEITIGARGRVQEQGERSHQSVGTDRNRNSTLVSDLQRA